MATYDLNRGQLNGLLAFEGIDPSVRKAVIDYLQDDGFLQGPHSMVHVETSDGGNGDGTEQVLLVNTPDATVATGGNLSAIVDIASDANLVVTGGDDVFVGTGPGSDTVDMSGTSGDDVVMTGAGDDSVLGGTGDDSIYGGGGQDTLVAGGDHQLLDGGKGADTLTGSSEGHDTLIGGDGSDSLSGGDGSHQLLIGDNSALSGDGDHDSDDGHGHGHGHDHDHDHGGSSGGGNDTLDAGSGSHDTLIGGSGSDVLLGGTGSQELLQGGNGNDTITASAGGHDTLDGGSGNDAFHVGSTGNDTVTGAGGHDTLFFDDGTFAGTTVDTNHHTGVTTVTFTGGQTVMVSGVEELVFTDHTVKL
jgi:Ca2+-binding RTX toxin-like protein